MADTFAKTAGFGDNLPGEAAALRWLAEAEAAGGIRVVRVLSVSAEELVEEHVATGAPTAAAAGRMLPGRPGWDARRRAGRVSPGAAVREPRTSRATTRRRAGEPSSPSTGS